jgi:hypothetical protein
MDLNVVNLLLAEEPFDRRLELSVRNVFLP